MASKDIIVVMLFAMLLFNHNCYGLNNMITLILNLFGRNLNLYHYLLHF